MQQDGAPLLTYSKSEGCADRAMQGTAQQLGALQLNTSQITTMGENREPTKPVPNCWIRNSVAMIAMEMPTILAAQGTALITEASPR